MTYVFRRSKDAGDDKHPSAADKQNPKPDTLTHVRWLRSLPELRKPTLIAAFEGWNDAGDAASMAARHLSTRWGCEPIARIDPELFYDFTSTRPTVKLDDDRVRSVKWPTIEVSAAHLENTEADVVVMVGIEPHLRWRTFGEQVIGLADKLGVGRVVTLGALLAEVPHSRPVQVFGTAEDEALRLEFNLTPSRYEGPTGIVGVLTSASREAGYPTASFWSTVPSYMPRAPSPKAALALVEKACVMTGAPVTTLELKQAADAYEREISKLLAEDSETSEYVARIENAWDKNQANRARQVSNGSPAGESQPPLLDADPAALVAEVERFLRESE